ncbi:adaptin ear-binding coat-associated protein 2 isoform X5 [Macaca fascicularis]|uniref:adaptin ear-binding coat-associated protein 2 isoform X5 n=1 Tax=Macaca fascicularis TaxID=9541 RepID=UPI0032B0650B
MEESGYESVLCVKPDVHVYRIPPRATNRGYRGAVCSGPGGSVSRHSCGECDGLQQVLRDPHRRWKWWVKQQCEFAKQAQNPDQGPKLDLGFKEGQTIKLNIANMKKKEGAAGNPRARPASTGGLSLLPPPPGGKTSTLIPPPGEQLAVGGSLTQPAVAPSSDQLPARPSPAQAGSNSDLSTIFPHVTSGKELPRLGQRKEGEALLSWPVFGV